MVKISPLRGLRYNTQTVGKLSDVLAPPYDVISPEQRDQMLKKSPYNMVRLILNPDADPYASAANYLQQWIADGALKADDAASYYIHYQTYTHPVTQKSLTRKGVLVRIKSEPFSTTGVRAHEKTLAGPKADRLKLTTATQTNFSPVFGLVPDTDERLLNWMEGITRKTAAAASFEFDGYQHELWCVSNEAEVQALTTLCEQRHVLIADGHHRYETAVAYAAEHRDSEAAQFTLMTLVPMSDPGLLVLPTHRLLQGFTQAQWQAAQQKVSGLFQRQSLSNLAELEKTLQQLPETVPAFGVLTGGQIELWQLRPGQSLPSVSGKDIPTAYDVLDLSWLHQGVFEYGLGMTAEDQSGQKYLQYFKSGEKALEALGSKAEPQLKILFYTRAIPLALIDGLAAKGLVMPQKSTYFYPKLPSGLVMNAHRFQEQSVVAK